MSGGGGDSDSTDKEYNRGMLALSQEQQSWAEEMFNLYKYGVTYNPTEKILNPNIKTTEKVRVQTGTERKRVYERSHGGEGGRRWEWKEIPVYEWVDKEVQDENAWTTRGELEGYNPDDYLSQMELENKAMFYQSELMPYDFEASKAQLEFEKEVAGLEMERAEAARGLLPQETETARSELEQREFEAQTGMKLGLERANLMSDLYKESLKGVDVNARVREARSDVAGAFADTEAATKRQLGRMGVSPTSGRGLRALGNQNIERAKTLGQGITTARNIAREEDWAKKTYAAGLKF